MEGDGDHVQQVLINSIGNAIVYTPMERSVTVGVEDLGDVVVSQVGQGSCFRIYLPKTSQQG